MEVQVTDMPTTLDQNFLYKFLLTNFLHQAFSKEYTDRSKNTPLKHGNLDLFFQDINYRIIISKLNNKSSQVTTIRNS